MIETINNLEFEYFTKEQLVEYKSSIEDRIKQIENGLIIEERPLRYFASCDVMYGDGDAYSQFTEEIDREEWIKLQLFSFLNICFYNEHLGDRDGIISDFTSVDESYNDLEEGSSLYRYDNELQHCIDDIDSYIEQYYPDDLNLEELYLLYQNDKEFNIINYQINFKDPMNHGKFIQNFLGKEYSHRTDNYQVIEVNEKFGEILKTILDIKPTKKFLFLNCLDLEIKHILKVYQSNVHKSTFIRDTRYYRAAEVDFIGEFNLTKYFE